MVLSLDRLSLVVLAACVAAAGSAARCAATAADHPAATRPAELAPREHVPTDVVVADVDGVERRPFDARGGKGTVLFFLSHDCPISNGYAPEINRICAAYGGDKGFSFTVVHPDGDLSAADAKAHAKAYGFAVPVVLDGKRTLTDAAKPRVTPEVVVAGPDGAILYRGRIDDKWAGYGKSRPEPTVRDLRDALDAVADGRPVPEARTDAIGCPI